MSQRLALFGPNVPERQCKTRRKVTFVGAEIDRLEVQIEASASRANAELNKLANKLDKVASSLSGINSKGLIGFANGIEKLGRSMQTVNSVKTSDFTRLANNIQKLTQLNTASLNTASSALNLFGKSLNSFGAASKSAGNIAVMANSLGKLGGKNIQTAISNLPQLSSALKGLLTTLSQAPNVSKNVIQITNALANLSSSLNGMRGSNIGSSVSKNVGGVFSTFGNLPKHVTRVNKSLGNFSQMAGKFYARFFLLIRGLKELGKAIETSMDYVETYNYFNVIMDKIGAEFGDMYAQFGYDSAEEYANSFAGRMNELTRKMTGYKVGDNGELTLTDSIGLALDPQAVMNYQASIAAVTNSVGLIGENSVNVSKALTMLSADMSSLKNVSLETAMTNFQSGLIGQSRALYKYGIDITNATLQTYAYDLGLSKSVSEMTQAEKMQLRMIAILDQSKVAWGDQANTINSVANQYRIMKQQISNLARVIGNLLLPIVQKVLPVINGMIIALQRLFSVLGFKLLGGNWLKNTMDGISGGYADDSLGDLEDDANGAAGGLKDAGKAAEKLKTMVRGIDELNILSQDTGNDSGSGSGIGSGAGGIDLSDAIGAALADYESVWDEAFKNAQNKAQEYADAICAVFKKMWDAIEPFRTAIVNLWDNGLSKLANFAWTGLKDFYHEFLVPIGTWALGTKDAGLTRLINVVNEGLMAIHWEELSASLKNFWGTIEPYAEQFGEGLIDFFEDISSVAVNVINKFPGLFNGITDALNKGNPENARSWAYALSILAVSIGGLKVVDSILNGISTFIKLIGNSALIKAVSCLAGGIKTLVSSISILKSGGLLETGGIFSSIVNVISLVAGGAGTLNEAMTAVFGSIATVASGIVGVVGGLALAIKNFFSMWENGWSILSEILKDIGIAIAAVGAVILGVAAAPAALVAGIVAAVSTLIIVIHDNWEAIKQFFTDTIPAWWSGTALPFIQSIPERFGELVSNIGIFLSELPGKIGYWLGEALGSFTHWIVETSIYLAEKVPEIIENIRIWFSELPSKIYEVLILIIEKLGEWKDSAVAFVTEKVPEIANKLLEIFVDLPGKFLEIGKNIIFGLWEGIQGTWEGMKKGIGDFCSGFIDGFLEAWGIHSPSRVMSEIGDYLILGLAEPFASASGITEQIYIFTDSLMNIFREQLSPENFSLIAENAMLAFVETFNLGFQNIQLVSGESMLLLSMSVVNSLALMNQKMSMIFTNIVIMLQQKWALMLNQTRLSWTQINNLVSQNLTLMQNRTRLSLTQINNLVMQNLSLMQNRTNFSLTQINNLVRQNLNLLNASLISGMTIANMNWSAKWDQFIEKVKVACSEVQDAVSALNDNVQQMCDSMMSAIRAVQAAASSMGSISVSGGSVRGFASGGYPETGELFMARENGINEMVGRIGNRSAVANNDQIVEAIRAAVVQGINTDEQNALLREQNALLRAILDKDMDVSLDGRSLVDGIDKARKRMGVNFQPA